MYETIVTRYMQENGFGSFCPKAVLFDMDGVLYDSMPNHAVSWHESMKTFHIEMPREDAYRYEGMRGVETIKLLTRQQWGRDISDEEAARMYAAKSERFALCAEAPVMEGVKQLQQLIHGMGLQIVVVTGSGQRSLLDKLTVDFEGLVDPHLVVSSFDVKRGKPHPETYLKGLEKVGVAPYEAVVIENAPLGVRAAVAARLFTIAVNTGPLPDAQLSGEGAHLVYKSMAEAEAFFRSLPTLSCCRG